MAGRGNRRNATQSEVTCGTKNCTGKRVGTAFEATSVGADIKAIPILSITRCDQGKNQHAASQHESLHVNPSKILKYVDYIHSISNPNFVYIMVFRPSQSHVSRWLRLLSRRTAV